MARMARLVVPGYPHHVTQRGNRRQSTFFSKEDYLTYIELLAAAKSIAAVEVWAYCLMPNHIHFIVVPEKEDSLAMLFKEAHRRYTRRINFSRNWKGHLWQERFHSCVMDEHHLLAAVRYVELNPVRSRLCEQAWHWPWSSTRAHLAGTDDSLVAVTPMLERIGNWEDYLSVMPPQSVIDTIRKHSRTGRPAGKQEFIETLEGLSNRLLTPRTPGRKKAS